MRLQRLVLDCRFFCRVVSAFLPGAPSRTLICAKGAPKNGSSSNKSRLGRWVYLSFAQQAENCVNLRPKNLVHITGGKHSGSFPLPMLWIQDARCARCAGIVPGLLVGGRRPGRPRRRRSAPDRQRTAQSGRGAPALLPVRRGPPPLSALCPKTGTCRAVIPPRLSFLATKASSGLTLQANPHTMRMR